MPKINLKNTTTTTTPENEYSKFENNRTSELSHSTSGYLKPQKVNASPVSYDKYMAVVHENEILRNIIIELNKKLYNDNNLITITNPPHIISATQNNDCEGCDIYEEIKKGKLVVTDKCSFCSRSPFKITCDN